MQKKKTPRTNYFINKKFQISHIFLMVLLQVIIATAIGLGFSWLYIAEANVQGFAWTVILFLLLIIVLSAAFTHSIVGPLHNLDNVIRQITRGAIPEEPFKFRKTDNFKWLARDFNNYLTALKKKKVKQKNATDNLKKLQNDINLNTISSEECLDVLKNTIDLLNK
jgi:methyl-accepting chemotaxis protein